VGPEDRVQGPVDHEDGRPQPRQAVEVAAADEGREGGRPAGRPEAAFDDRLGDRSPVARAEERQAGDVLSGARGTPSLFINGELYGGSLERDEIFAALARAAVALVP